MSPQQAISAELDKLLGEVRSLVELPKGVGKELEFSREYQKWYTRSLKLVQVLGPDRANEFRGYYEVNPKRKDYTFQTYVIQDFVKGAGAATDLAGKEKWDSRHTVQIRLVSQSHILESLRSRIEGILADVSGALLAQLEDAELRAAETLRKVSARAAGALAGVVLERHLQHVAANRGVVISKKHPTIADLNDPLKNAGLYDLASWRKIQYLADLRNLCSHKKDRDPTRDEAAELIQGVNWAVKSIL